ncbi:J domain-containing protein [Hyphobacterium sp.]|uniref:J domain-containing protein n=1 Tax=Hyphobacterium sp. TaxID=2004662 RepID=UPI003BA8A2F8
MPFLILGFVALIVLVLLSRAFARMETAEAARWSRITLGLAITIVGGLISLRGLAFVGAPIATFGIGMMAIGAGFRPKPRRNDGQASPPATPTTRSREEALDLLGLEGNPDETEIREAYRKLMKKVHPDSGGTDGLSRRLTEARDILLKD